MKILNRDVGFVKTGQPVAVKVEAFPFTRYGVLAGTVESFGSDAVEDEKLGLVYPARISLQRSATFDKNAEVKPSVGMQATADIQIGRRSILSYLLSPIDAAAQ